MLPDSEFMLHLLLPEFFLVQPVIPALHPGGGGVGDTLPGGFPAYLVAPPLHLPDEFLPAAGQLHDRLHGGDELEFPALSPHRSPILPGT